MIKVVSDNNFTHMKGEHYASLNKTGEVLAYFGLVTQWDGVGRVYYRHENGDGIGETRTIFKDIRRILKERMPYYDRIEATVDVESDVDYKFADKLSFVTEGCMKKYVNGENHFMMRYCDE